MKMQLSRISVHQTSLVVAILYGGISLVVAVPLGLIGLLFDRELGPTGFGFSLGILCLAPLFYLIFGYIGTALGCLAYNLVARFAGGVEFELEDLAQGPEGLTPSV